MSKYRVLVLFLTLLVPAALHAQPGPNDRLAPVINEQSPAAIPDQYLVILQPGTSREGVAAAENAIQRAGGRIMFRYKVAVLGFGIHIPAVAVQGLRSIPNVAYIEADVKFTGSIIQLNPPTGLDRTSERFLPLDNQYTYNVNETGAGVHVYVLDSGMRLTHSEFTGRVFDEVDEVDGSLPGADCHGHGTHVTGTIGGTTYGIAKNVTLHNVRVLDCFKNGTETGVVAGIEWVTTHRILPAVANMSLGTSPGLIVPTVDTAVANSIASGVTYCIAAGNDNADACTVTPAHVAAAITVGAIDPTNDTRPSFSNWGACVDLFASGVNIVSAGLSSDTASATMSGTSMATPHVTGVAALYLQNHATATPAMVLAAIHANADTSANSPPWAGIGSPGAGSPNELLHWGSLDDGFTDGDPHLTTVDGAHYDFQSAGEFVSLRDGGTEIQTRQTPIATTFFPGPNDYTGLASCVSLNTAVAARVGAHRVTYQPNISGVPDPSGMQLRVDGVLTALGPQGLDLTGGGRIARAPAGDGIEVQFPDESILYVTPGWWADQQKWYLNVHAARTRARQGILGAIAPGSWLPALPDGTSVGKKPASPSQRYTDLNQTFANAWRVTSATSLFDYAPGTSTATFTFPNWPLDHPPCTLPNVTPAKPADPAVAEQACQALNGDVKKDCIFDVSVTGNPGFAATYLLAQRIRNSATNTTLADNRYPNSFGDTPSFTATVRPLKSGVGTPAGFAQFFLDGIAAGTPVRIDANGRAFWKAMFVTTGTHSVAASFVPDPGSTYLPSRSGDLDAIFFSCGNEPGYPDSNPPLTHQGERLWFWGGAVGSSHPLGKLNRVADANIYAKVDAVRQFNPVLAVRLALGFAQFSAEPFFDIPHPHYTHLSANAQWLAPFGVASRWFVNGGPGWYRDKSGSTSAGANVGAGVQIDAAGPNKIELGADYHFVNKDRARFVTWHLGILFR